MIEDPRPLVFALAKLGLSHSAIAHSFGLATSLLRLEALASLHPARNTTAALFHLKHHQPPPQTPNNRRSPPEGFYVFNNDGEPNDGL
jgi:hypothetical protein